LWRRRPGRRSRAIRGGDGIRQAGAIGLDGAMRRRDYSLNILLAIAASVVVIAIVYGVQLLSARTNQLADTSFAVGEARLNMTKALNGLLEAESSQRGFLITRDEAYLEPYETARDHVNKALADLETLLKSLDDRDASGPLTELRSVAEQIFVELNQTIALTREGQNDEALAIVRDNSGLQLMDRARDIVAAEQEKLNDLRSQVVGALEDSARKLALLTSLGVFAVVVLSLAAVAQMTIHARQLNRAHEELASINEALEERVRDRTKELRRANEEIQRYAYVVGHDLRAPLINIVGFTKELETAVQTIQAALDALTADRDNAKVCEAARAVEEDVPEALRFIRASTGRMDKLLKAILDLSRLGRAPLRPEALDLAKLVEECIAAQRSLADQANANVSIEGVLPSIVGDRAALEQIVSNLLDNAVKYLSPMRCGDIIVRGRRDGAMVQLEFADNGRGIAQADQQRIFELFRRAGKQDRPGEGIGLAHVQSLVRRLGAEIAVTSDGVSGSTFTLTLPHDLRRVLSEGAADHA
jgi:signal transduction histidine kinase